MPRSSTSRAGPRSGGSSTRVLAPFYERVLLLDLPDGDWWKDGKHFVERYAEACGCPAPDKGILYLAADNRRAAADYLRQRGLDSFIYVAQMVRHRLPFRSWPLAHYHALLRLLHERLALPIVVDTVGSDEAALPDFCVDAGRLDVLTAAAVIERARLFVGSDSGLTHVAGALGTPTVAIHLGYPPETCAALGDRVVVVRQRRPFDDPAATSPEEVLALAVRQPEDVDAAAVPGPSGGDRQPVQPPWIRAHPRRRPGGRDRLSQCRAAGRGAQPVARR